VTPEARPALLRLIDALRTAVEASTSIDASAADLEALADRAHSLARDLTARAGRERPFDRFSPPLDRRDPAAMIPFSPISGPYNPIAAPFAMHVEDVPGQPPKLVARVTFGRVFEGPPHNVHGGIVSAAWDQLLAFANLANHTGGPTGSLTVKYRKPTPIEREVTFEAWADRIEGRKVWVHGRCTEGGEVLTESEGLFVRFDAERAARAFPRAEE